MKDKNLFKACNLSEEDVESIKGWVRGYGEFNLIYRNKPSWKEIYNLFWNPCKLKIVPALCVPFCKGITKKKEDVESIAVPLYI